MPQYLRLAIRRAINSKDIGAGVESADLLAADEVDYPPEYPMIVFVNSKSGGRHGPRLKLRLQQLMGEEQTGSDIRSWLAIYLVRSDIVQKLLQTVSYSAEIVLKSEMLTSLPLQDINKANGYVYDLSDVKPNELIQYGLGCLEQLSVLDPIAKQTREKLRMVVAGGDGTVGWVLGCLGELHKEGRYPVPPVAVIPLGTGNDLSRSFGWGGSFPFAWRAAVKRSLQRASVGPICRLDSWRVSITMPAGEVVELPHSLKLTGECTLDQDVVVDGELPEKVTCYDGVFYNYFSIGMDAQVAYGFHTLRNEKPYLAQGPIANKMIYSGYSCTQGWFFTPCVSNPGLRGLKNILRIHIKKVNCAEWEQVRVPSNVRSIVALNLHNYGSGRHPWGNLSPEYLEKRGFVEANADDGLIEIFGLKHGWHASFVMVEIISAKHIAQAAAIRFEVRGGEWKRSYMQMDGEPWKQPLDKEYSTFVEIKRNPNQSLMIRGE
ncbi:hypothetical protein KSS87_023713 [Heliosperma pusillum]|nr:hypothetical protein KSS87_023713 [Heliosperma pusillum]